MYKILFILLFYSCICFAQDSVVYKRKIIIGKIVDYSPMGVLVRDSNKGISYYHRNYKRLVFSDTLVVLNRIAFPFERKVDMDTIFLKNGEIKLFTKSYVKGARGTIKEDELLFSSPSHGSDYFVVNKFDIQRITNYYATIISSGRTKYFISDNNPKQSHVVYLKNGIVFKTDFCYFKRALLAFEDPDISRSTLYILRRDLEKIIYADSTTVYLDTIKSGKNKKHPPINQIKHSKFYPYWTKKNYIGINITNFFMCDFNLSYYRSILKNKFDIGLGVNIPIVSTSHYISNLSYYNNQYYNFNKNYEFVLSAEYYVFHSEFFKNMSFGLVYRHTNFNYTYVDNSSGYYKNDNYRFIENRSERIANACFTTFGYLIPVRKCFFFKVNLGVGWEQYDDPYQLYKGQELKGSFLAAYTNFMAGFKF